jgi:hypothetical protein
MGADFLFDCVIINEKKTNEQVRASLLIKCASIKLTDFTECDRGNISEMLDIDITRDTLSELKTRFREIINDTFNTLNSRACSILNFRGYNIHLTGGMSWGDAPTDAFDTFGQFNVLPRCLHKLLE